LFRTFLALAACLHTNALFAAPDGSAFFEKKVRPVLVEKCVSCHGEKKQAGGLRVDSRKALLTGGDRGPALVPNKPEQSLLVQAIRHNEELKMPQKTKLPQADIAAIAEWVKLGAPWPDDSAPATPTASKGGERVFTAEEKAFWAFQPVKRPAVPEVKNKSWVKNPIDPFILSKLEAAGMKPAGEADRRTLLRRVTFDLTGLPPTIEELEAFLRDARPDAWERVVERLLASPAYGERQGRRWLDVARYADSNGMDENLSYANAWRYRDWVIKSFNEDVPYNRFIRDQIAGDLVPGGTDAERADRLTATGFLLVGPKMLAEDDPMKMRMDIIDEQLDTAGQAILGLTLGCARCHDHKFDPITAADYYGLAGFFYSTKSMKNYSVVAVWNERSIASASETAALAEFDKKLAAKKSAQAAQDKPGFRGVLGFAAVANHERHRKENAAFEKTRPKIAEVMAVEDEKKPQNLKVHLRGNHLTLGAEAPRRFPKIISDAPLSLGSERSGRLEFAEWMAKPENPLTARVMANRIWAGHFGTGIVRTPDNFGRLGERPTHPELLDFLASEFTKSGWSVKSLHRLIVNSNAYRMASSATILQADPENRLYSHFNRRRLEAEELRDALFATAGTLDRTPGGTLLPVPNRQYVTSTANRNFEGYQSMRRAVYLPVIRSAIYDVFQTFDFPDPSVPNGNRSTTTVPTQALMLMNGQVTDRAAESLAKVLLAKPGDDAARIGEAYRLTLGRDVRSAEVEKVQAYLKKSESSADSKLSAEAKRLLAWRGFCRVLFASNEFAFVE
jgi:cytochrome c553